MCLISFICCRSFRMNWLVSWWLSLIRDICCISSCGTCSLRRWSWQIPCRLCFVETAWPVKSWPSVLRYFCTSYNLQSQRQIKWINVIWQILKVQNFSHQVYGATYLQKLLEPLLRRVLTGSEWQMLSFEVDSTR